MRKITTFLIVSMVMSMFYVPEMKAIITSPDDYLIYTTGILGDTAVASKFSFTDAKNVSFTKTDGVKVNLKLKWGRGITDPTAFGYPADYPYKAASTIVGGIHIPENEKFSYRMTEAQWDEAKGDTAALKTQYRWWYNGAEKVYSRPSDSLVIRVPADIDSILIEGAGTNTGYGLIVYELDGGFDNGWFNAGNYGKGFARIGFKPQNYGKKDSVDIVILGAYKDWFIPQSSTEWTDKGSFQFKQLSIAYANQNYKKGERWGKFSQATINQIKVYDNIVPSYIPTYEESKGVLAKWTFAYMPISNLTGTPDVNNPAPTDGSTIEAGNKIANEEGCMRALITVPSAIGNMHLGMECGEVPNAKIVNIGCNDTLFTTWASYNKYFQVEFTTAGYNNVILDFDFNLRGSSDSLVVLYARDGKNYQVAGKFATTEDFSGLNHVSIKLPVSNCVVPRVRLVPDHTDEGDGYPSDGELIIANLSIKAGISSKVLYLHRDSNGDEIYALFNDYLLSLMKSNKYEVDPTYYQADSLTADSLTINDMMAPYDAIVISSAVEAKNPITPVLKYLVGRKPVLNMSYESYQAWGWATPTSGNVKDSVESKLFVNEGYEQHPIFNGVKMDEGCVDMFTSIPYGMSVSGLDTLYGYFGVQGFEQNTLVRGGNLVAGSGDMVSVHEINTNPAIKYLMVGTSKVNRSRLSAGAKTLLVNALDYLFTKEAYNKPTGLESAVATVLDVHTSGNEILVKASEGASISIYNLMGEQLYNKVAQEGMNNFRIGNQGIYLVKVNTDTVKVIVK